MLLTVSKGNSDAKQLRFAQGPIHIGRIENAELFLPDKAVSRRHAIIYSTKDDKWILEDLDSANKTSLNGQPIHKAEINTGDVIQIMDFIIQVDLENVINNGHLQTKDKEATTGPSPEDLEDTLVVPGHQVIIRRPSIEHAPAVRFPAKRIKDFILATEAICKADGLEEVLDVLLKIALKQFFCYHVWCGLRSQPISPLNTQAGKKHDGTKVKMTDLKFQEQINESVEKKFFFLFPRIPADKSGQRDINSVMIAPILGQTGCLGVLYIDNGTNHESYNISDLDYLMFIAIHTAAIIENF
jgi:pSer/pThr/pTyr-binding forkhead associated (FHA) protein